MSNLMFISGFDKNSINSKFFFNYLKIQTSHYRNKHKILKLKKFHYAFDFLFTFIISHLQVKKNNIRISKNIKNYQKLTKFPG